MLLLLWCSGCTWREGCVGNDLDSGRVYIVVDDKGLLPVRVPQLCCLVVMISIAIVESLSGCSFSCCTWREGRHGDKYVDRGHVNVVDVDRELLRSETNKHNK